VPGGHACGCRVKLPDILCVKSPSKYTVSDAGLLVFSPVALKKY